MDENEKRQAFCARSATGERLCKIYYTIQRCTTLHLNEFFFARIVKMLRVR
jgi:hypothetical protein